MPRQVSEKRAQRLRRYWDKHARSYDREMGFFDRHLFRDSRQWVCSQATGEILEVAIGTGLNLHFATLVLSIRCANQATTFSKSLVCRAFGRAHGTWLMRTRRQAGQSTPWMSASNHTGQAPKSRCRHRRREES